MGAVTEYGVGVVMDTPSDRGGGLLGGGGGGGGDDGVREGQREKKSNKEQRKRSRRGGGGRRKQRRTGGNSTVEAGKEPADEEPIPNHVPTSHPSDSTSVSMATLGDSVGVANLPVPLRVVSDGTAGGVMTSESTHQQSVGMRGSGGDGKTGGTNGRKGSIGYDFRAVRIKEEPVDDSTTSGVQCVCVCVCVCARARARACVRACVCVHCTYILSVVMDSLMLSHSVFYRPPS